MLTGHWTFPNLLRHWKNAEHDIFVETFVWNRYTDKPFIYSPKITFSNQYKKSFSEQKIIYILGNFNYKPNYKALLKTISFLENKTPLPFI